MKKYIYIILIYMTSLIASSCSDWFDVTAPSEIRKDDHFSSVTGFQQSLIGCYIGMTDDALYGTNLSWFATEIMAHQFNPYVNSTNIGLAYWLQSFNYTNTYTTPTVEEIWEKAYNVIVNVNDELANIEEKKEILDDLNYHIIKGELLAIRAYIHFDLLRLYGYGNWSQRDTELDEKRTIPYATEVSKDPAPQYSGAETIKLLLNDLNEAAALLKDYDPITKTKAASFYQEYSEVYVSFPARQMCLLPRFIESEIDWRPPSIPSPGTRKDNGRRCMIKKPNVRSSPRAPWEMYWKSSRISPSTMMPGMWISSIHRRWKPCIFARIPKYWNWVLCALCFGLRMSIVIPVLRRISPYTGILVVLICVLMWTGMKSIGS